MLKMRWYSILLIAIVMVVSLFIVITMTYKNPQIQELLGTESYNPISITEQGLIEGTNGIINPKITYIENIKPEYYNITYPELPTL